MTRRILLSYLSLVVLVLVLLEVPLGRFLAEREEDRLLDGLRSDAVVLAAFYEDVLDQGAALEVQVAEDYTARTGARVAVVDETGVSLIDTEAAPDRDLSTRPEVAEALAGRVATGTRHSDTLGADLAYVAVPVASGGEVHGAVRLTLATSAVHERVERYWVALAAAGAVILAAVGLIGWAVARSLTRPVRQLEDAAAVFASGDLAPQAPPAGAPGELVALSGSLNRMAERLSGQIDRQRAFVADASHQLRTPLTALQLNLEEAEVMAADEVRPGIEAALREVDRLTTLVDQLLRLARADHQAVPVPVDVAAAARERVETWAAVAEASEVDLRFTGPASPVVAQLAPGAIDQVLDNVIDNALTVSAPGSTIEVRVRAGDPVHEVAVVDHGPGLTDDAKRRAVERFWRQSGATSGTGLGLAIVESLVTGAGGELVLSDTPGGGLTVTARLPAAPPAGRGRVP